jgi:hypothetical protein
MKPLSYLFFLVFFWTACQNSTPKEDYKSLFDEVMAIHDAVMPKTDDIYKLKRKLNEYRADLDKEKNSAERQLLTDAILRLEKANDSMMDWMNAFDADYEKKSPADIKPYLLSEKQKITAVSDSMLHALADGQKLLEKSSKSKLNQHEN